MLLRVAALLLAASAPTTTDDSATAAKRLPAAVPLGACTVSLGSNATASEQFAAAELSTIGGNMSGGDSLPIQRGEAGAGAPPCTIAVGYDAAVAAGVPPSQLAESKLGFEGYVVSDLGASVWAATGADGAPRGAVFAAYELLERMGWMQLAWDEELMPAKPPQMPAAISVARSGAPSGVTWREVDDW